MLIAYLPADSALHRELAPDHVGWTVNTSMLANLYDVLAMANWQRENAGLEKGKTPTRRPKPMWRPGVSSGKPRRSQEQLEREWGERAAQYERERQERIARGE